MKFFALLLLVLALSKQILSQQSFDLPHCKCVDEIQRSTPILDGKYTRTCRGKLIESGAFSNGEKDGEWTTYNPKGKIIRKLKYQKGKIDGPVDLFYADGTPKLTASFFNGSPNGEWTYYTSKGKKWIDGSYNQGVPVGQWTIRDRKGNNIILQYDYSVNLYVKNGDASFLNDKAILQNDNTSEYFILHIPRRPENNGPSPLGGFHFSSDLMVQLAEVPLDYWDTYVNYKYQMSVGVKENHLSTFTLKIIDKHMPDNTTLYPFIVNTDRDAQLKRVQHSSLSKTLLDYKVKDALSLLMPWTNEQACTIEVYVPFVINDIVGL
jgi:hypothetical protein